MASHELNRNASTQVPETQTLSEPADPPDDVSVNPYAAPASVTTAVSLDGQIPVEPPKPARVIVKWLMVCVIAAGPSFYFGGGIGGWRGPEVLGMIFGILIFVAGYSLIEFVPQIRSAMAQRAKRRASRIAYITRMGISVLFPIGVFVDLYCGIVSVGLSGALTGSEIGGVGALSGRSEPPTFRFLVFLLTTLVQGTLLNMLVFTYMLIVYGFLRLFGVDNSTRKKNDVEIA